MANTMGGYGPFTTSLNAKKLEAQFLRAQRMESIGTLASGVAHDLSNILTPIMMSMAVLRMGIAEDKRVNLYDTIELSAVRRSSSRSSPLVAAWTAKSPPSRSRC